jgi:hypothetical protein
MAGETVCMVHTHVAPCPRDGQPASATVLHTHVEPSRDSVLRMWRVRTACQRTLVIHSGDFTDGSHRIGPDDVDCSCRPEVLWAVQLEPQKGVA